MVRVLTALAVATLGIAAVAAQSPAPIDLQAFLEQYERGEGDAAVAKAAAISDLGPLRLRFVQDTPRWINADPAQAEARGAAVAAFLVELAGARLESDWGRFQDLIEFTCVQLRTAGPPTEFERRWHAATHALAGRARNRVWMLGEFAVLPHQKPFNRPPSDPQHPPARHLMHALERFPDDPRFQLSRIVAWTWGRDSEPVRNLRDRNDDRPERLRRAPQLEAIVALEPLTSVQETAAEAFVRIGTVQFTAGDFAASLKAFESAQAIATEPAMKYVAFLSAGRALEALSKPDDAIASYRRALDVIPNAESATVALASLQFARDEREAAVTMIDRVFNRKPSPADPGRLIGYGSFLRWPDLKTAMRKAVSSYSGGAK